MGVRNQEREVLNRLEAKTLDARFLAEIRDGLNCSPFEAQAVLSVVHEVYAPCLDCAPAEAPPGRVTLVAVSAEEPAGKPLAKCQKLTVTLTVHRGAEDDQILKHKGPAAFRQARIPDLCQQALSQGAVLTAEDLAYRVFFVTPRTITRDLAALRQSDPRAVIPMRSTLHDMGPALTHRVQIVRQALTGKTTHEISRSLRHSPEAVANYLSTFTRCVQLSRRNMAVNQIAFLVRRGPGLVERYVDLLNECESAPEMQYHLDELLRLGACAPGKKIRKEGAVDG